MYITSIDHWLKTTCNPSGQKSRSHVSLKPSQPTIESIEQQQYIGIHQEISIHRLSAASLLQSLRARDRGLVIEMAEDSSSNAFSFAGHAAAPAAPTQSNSSQSIDTGGSDNSELGTQMPRRALVAPRGRLPTIPAIEDTDGTPGKRRSSTRQSSPPMTPRTKAKPTSSNPPSPIQDATPSGIGSYQRVICSIKW